MRFEIFVDRTESADKCTILPLSHRDDFRIRRFDRRYPIAPLTGTLLLHPQGEPLTTASAGQFAQAGGGVLSAIDCNWKRLDRIVAKIAGPLPPLVRIPDGFQTAYLRRNKRDLDPDQGLATIEALFLASAFLGCWDESLLSQYGRGDEFLAANAPAFERYGIGPGPLGAGQP